MVVLPRETLKTGPNRFGCYRDSTSRLEDRTSSNIPFSYLAQYALCWRLPLARWLSPPVFTGDPAADFIDPSAVVFADPDGPGDVGTPASFPAGVVSGWSADTLYAQYDRPSDTLYIGIDCDGICGDADGNGVLSNLIVTGGTDHPS